MKFYLVGGAVRDKILGLKNNDRDWVVVGCTYKKMISMGFKPVGNSFPVFIHPKTKEEYALARTDKKIGVGYRGFVCHFSSKITLKEDLYRRDLTINAIALDKDGNYYDPFHGLDDIKHKVLRHISYAFVEDPLRVLRVARFYAFFYKLKFKIHQSTLNLMRCIVMSGELLTINFERIWKETEKVFCGGHVFYYFYILNKCNALKFIYPEIVYIFQVKKLSYYFYFIFVYIKNYKKLDNFRLKINFLFFCLFCDKNFVLTGNFTNLNFILDKLCLLYKRLNFPKNLFLLSKRILNFIYLYLNFVKGYHSLSQIILKSLYYLDVWRNFDNLSCALITLKLIKFFPINNKDLILFIQKFLLDIFHCTIHINKNFILKQKNKQKIKHKIYNFRLKKVKYFLVKHSFA